MAIRTPMELKLRTFAKSASPGKRSKRLNFVLSNGCCFRLAGRAAGLWSPRDAAEGVTDEEATPCLDGVDVDLVEGAGDEEAVVECCNPRSGRRAAAFEVVA